MNPQSIGIRIPPQTYQHSIGAKTDHLNRPIHQSSKQPRDQLGSRAGFRPHNTAYHKSITRRRNPSPKPPRIKAPEHGINLGRAGRRSPWLAARPTNGMRGDWRGTGTGDGGGERRCNATTWTREPRPLCFWLLLFQLGCRSVIKKEELVSRPSASRQWRRIRPTEVHPCDLSLN